MIEISVLSNLIYNDKFFKKTIPYIKDEYFETNGAKKIFQIIQKFASDYNKQPNKESIALLLESEKISESIYDESLDILDSIDDSKTDTDFIVKQTEDWCKNRALYIAMNEAISIMDDEDKNHLSKSAIPELMKNALTVSFDSDIGHDYFAKAEEQYTYYHDQETRIKFPLAIFNRLTNGGYKKKTLNIIQAGINVGKTTFLIWLASEAVKAGMNVLYFTLEIDEKTVHERVDTTLMGCTFNSLRNFTRDEYLNRVKLAKSKTEGSLIVKEYPTDTANVNHFRHIISEAKMKKGFVPDLIIVDYLTIMCSAKLSNTARGNSDLYYTAVASELRALAQENDVPIWTASQLTRSGQTSDNVNITDGGLSLGIAKTADFMFALMQPEELAAEGFAIGSILKNRYANKSSFKKFKIILDNDTQTLRELDENSSMIKSEEEPKVVNRANAPGFKPKAKADASNFKM